jgi:hypothetical protein
MIERTLTVGELSANPGERAAGEVSVKIGGGVAIQLPIFLINGTQDGPRLGITAGVHGDEFAAVSAALWVAQALDPSDLKGSVVVAPVSNPPGFWQRRRLCPLDQKNLSNEFPGREDGSATQILAHWLLEQVISKSDYYLDLHGGDLYEALIPFVICYRSGNKQVDRASFALAKSYGIDYVVEAQATGSGYTTAANMGIPAILAEAGGQGFRDSEMVEVHTQGVQRVLRHLRMLEEPPEEGQEVELFRTFAGLNSEHNGYFYPQTAVGQRVSKGDQLGVVRDYLGNELQVAEAPASGMILVVTASLPINAGEPLFYMGAP